MYKKEMDRSEENYRLASEQPDDHDENLKAMSKVEKKSASKRDGKSEILRSYLTTSSKSQSVAIRSSGFSKRYQIFFISFFSIPF